MSKLRPLGSAAWVQIARDEDFRFWALAICITIANSIITATVIVINIPVIITVTVIIISFMTVLITIIGILIDHQHEPRVLRPRLRAPEGRSWTR